MPNITFSVDTSALANAKAFAAERSTTLNKLVNAYLKSLTHTQPRRAVSKADEVLLDYSLGRISVAEAASRLGVHDAGHVFALLRRSGLPFPQLPDKVVKQQVAQNMDFFTQPTARKSSRPGQKQQRR